MHTSDACSQCGVMADAKRKSVPIAAKTIVTVRISRIPVSRSLVVFIRGVDASSGYLAGI
jgi:hypothetical protein